MNWRRVCDYTLQGDGYAISLSRVGDRVAYQLWRDAPNRFEMPTLLQTITDVDPEDKAARIAAVNKLKLEAESYG